MKRQRPSSSSTTTTTMPSLPQCLWLLSLLPSLSMAQMHTESGYDNIAGDDAICWSTPRQVRDGGQHSKNPLVPNFIGGPTTMMSACPTGTSLGLELLSTPTHGSDKLRTQQYYTFHVMLDIDLQSIRRSLDLAEDAFFFSHKAQSGKTGFTHPQIALQLEFCPISGNLCTPFMFEGLMEGDGLNMLQVGNIEDRGEEDEEDNRTGPLGGLPPRPGRPHHFQDDGDVIEYQTVSSTTENNGGSNRRRLQVQSTNDHNSWWRKLLTTFNIIDEPEEPPTTTGTTSHIIGGEPATNSPPEENNYWEIPNDKNSEQPQIPPPPPPPSSPLPPGENWTSTIEEHEAQPAAPNQQRPTQQPTPEHTHNNDDASTLSPEAKKKIRGAAASPEFFFEIARDANLNQTRFQIHYNVEIQVPEPGDYLPMATVLFFVSNQTQPIEAPRGPLHMMLEQQHALYKMDVSALLADRSVTYYPPIEIHTVSTPAKVVSYLLIGACALVQGFFLVSTIRHRNENVLQLSQVGFLVALQVSSLVAILSSVFYLPVNDAFCYLMGPTTVIPLQLIFAIVYGRLRRIHSIMAPLLSFNTTNNQRHLKRGFRRWKKGMGIGGGSSQNESTNHNSTAGDGTSTTEQQPEAAPTEAANAPKIKQWLATKIPFLKAFQPRNSLRQEFSQSKLIALVVLVTLPVVIMEACLALFLDTELHLVLNVEESVGRYECGSEHTQTIQLASTGILFVTIAMDLYQAQKSKALPAFFNEASAVDRALASAMLITAVGFAVLVVSDGPEGEPDLTYLMEVLIVLCTALNLSIRLTLPKLKLIWRGEKVVVSRLLRDHKQSQQAKQQQQSNRPSNSNGPLISGLDASYTAHTSVATSSYRNSTAMQRMEEGHQSNRVGGASSTVPGLSMIDEDKCATTTAEQPLRKRIAVQPGEAPPSKLTMQLLSHTTNAQRINEKVLAGYQVGGADWNQLAQSVEEFQALLQGYEFETEGTDSTPE